MLNIVTNLTYPLENLLSGMKKNCIMDLSKNQLKYSVILYSVCMTFPKGEKFMKTASKVKESKSNFNDEFENYLKKQCIKTTFNGSELETFSWYKKVLGLV